MDIAKKRWLIGGGVTIFFIISLTTVYLAGYSVGYAETKNIKITAVKNANTPEEVTGDFSVFWEAWETLLARQINAKEITPRDMVEGAIKGLAGAFNDPYTVYFNPADSKKFNEEVRGNFGGIGAEIGMRNEVLTVVAPLKDTPAERSGLKPKDQIIEINNESTQGLTVDEAVKKIRGDIGTKVILTIFREGWDKVQDFEIVREVIRIPTVEYELLKDNLLHLSLYQFNDNAESQLGNALRDSANKNAQGLILDLRNNPGGYLNVAVDLAGWFLAKDSVVVKQRSSGGEELVLKSDGNEMLKDFPVVVLINEGSASAAEILAGALRDNRDIKIVGVKSFGKGTVQELDNLKDGSTLKITIANWLLPKGSLIDKNGIEPDFKVELDEEKFTAENIDTQLNKAIEVLKGEIR